MKIYFFSLFNSNHQDAKIFKFVAEKFTANNSKNDIIEKLNIFLKKAFTKHESTSNTIPPPPNYQIIPTERVGFGTSVELSHLLNFEDKDERDIEVIEQSQKSIFDYGSK